ncbi:hypothetical protein GCM10022244_08990 [Streptomyces gulbargensis]|uniref:ABC transporter permease n=1 Tax=Streptomyces gulbargensis TaxID=364901 RepID=A0ABP7LK60_9ACTN
MDSVKALTSALPPVTPLVIPGGAIQLERDPGHTGFTEILARSERGDQSGPLGGLGATVLWAVAALVAGWWAVTRRDA